MGISFFPYSHLLRQYLALVVSSADSPARFRHGEPLLFLPYALTGHVNGSACSGIPSPPTMYCLIWNKQSFLAPASVAVYAGYIPFGANAHLFLKLKIRNNFFFAGNKAAKPTSLLYMHLLSSCRSKSSCLFSHILFHRGGL